MGRRERRAELARYRKEAADGLVTYLVPPGDDRLAKMPLLQRAARSWLGELSVRVRHCIVCNMWIVDRRDVGLLLLTHPAGGRPTSASVSGVCTGCAALPLPALQQAALTSLKEAVPGAYFAPARARREAAAASAGVWSRPSLADNDARA